MKIYALKRGINFISKLRGDMEILDIKVHGKKIRLDTDFHNGDGPNFYIVDEIDSIEVWEGYFDGDEDDILNVYKINK
jgi:hypothetical protein